MSTKTVHIGLDKLEATDLVRSKEFNNNMDTLDEAIAALQTKDTELTGELESLAGEVGVMESSVAAIDAALTAQDAKNAAFQLRDQELQVDIEDLQAALAARKDQRVVTFRGSGVEIRYPWAGEAQQIQINCAAARPADINFQVERQAKADYETALGNWQKLGGRTFNLPPGGVYREYAIADALAAGDVLRFITANDDSDVTVEVFIQNN
ncbi:MAG TPA: hypothetical protein PKA10_18395 [Selenomonadales bacterium]|nr:hypothetical protein [Selenomonadales bacterium]